MKRSIHIVHGQCEKLMSFTVDTSNLSEDQLLIGFPSAGGEVNDISEDARGFIEFVEQD